MGINLGAITPISTDNSSNGGAISTPIQSPAPVQNMVQEVRKTDGTLTLNLAKGLSLDLSKTAPNMKRIKIGLGWTSKTGEGIDLDVFALTLRNGKVTSNSDIIFFNQKDMGTGVTLNGDNTTGVDVVGQEDDEQILIDTNRLDRGITSIAIFVNAYKPGINFGMVQHAYVRLVDADTNKEHCIYILNEEAGMNNAFHFANIKINNGTLNFETVGQPTNGDIGQIANRFL